MTSWNPSTTAEEQTAMTSSYQYYSPPIPQYQPPVVPSSYMSAGNYNSNMQSSYTSARAPNSSSQAFYGNAGGLAPQIAQPNIQQAAPGSLAALEHQLCMSGTPYMDVSPPQQYLATNISSGYGNMSTATSFPGAGNNANLMPNFPMVDQGMLSAGPSSAYSTPPTFYDSEEAWSFDSSGQEVQSSSSSVRNQSLQSQRGRRSPSEKRGEKAAGTSESTYDCPVDGCNKTFNRSYNYRAHMETHSANRVYPFDCPLEDCDKRFRRKTDLQRHHLSVHEKQRDHQCEFCGRFFSRKDTLRRHRDDGCSKRFETSFDLSASPGLAGSSQPGKG